MSSSENSIVWVILCCRGGTEVFVGTNTILGCPWEGDSDRISILRVGLRVEGLAVRQKDKLVLGTDFGWLMDRVG